MGKQDGKTSESVQYSRSVMGVVGNLIAPSTSSYSAGRSVRLREG